MEKPDPYHPSLPHVVTTNSYNLSPLLPYRQKVFALLFPHPVYVPHPISKWPARPVSHSLYPGYKSGLRTPVQCRFSLELACCSNSVSHSNILIFLSFCLMSGNSFLTCTWTTTHSITWGLNSKSTHGSARIFMMVLQMGQGIWG